MPKITMIGRASDGLPLAASMADQKDAYSKELQIYERQAKKIFRSFAEARKFGRPPPQENNFVTLESGDFFCFHYIIDSDVCFLTLTEKRYPRKLAYDYIDELRKEFLQMHGSKVGNASRPYEFLRFDNFIQKTKELYNDSRTQRNLEKLNTELKDVRSIMTKNINEVISRGEQLENVTEKSSRLMMESKRYSAQAKRAYQMRIVKQYTPVAVVIIVVLLLFWFFRLR